MNTLTVVINNRNRFSTTKKLVEDLLERNTVSIWIIDNGSIRVAGNFTCRHIPWYMDLGNLDEEERYYIAHTDPSLITQYTKQHKALVES